MPPPVLHVHEIVGYVESVFGDTLMATLDVFTLLSKSEALTLTSFVTATVPSTPGATRLPFQTLGFTGSSVMATLAPSMDAVTLDGFTPTSASTIVAVTVMVS